MKKNFFAVVAVLISSYMQGQDTTAKSLDEVIVTANKISQKQSSTGKVVTVIDQAMLQRYAGKTIGEILNYQAGVFVNGANNTLGTNQDIYFRGSGTGNVLVLIDGIPVNDPSQINNSFDINSLNPALIERIEILKGAQSTLWGSDAVAGVLNIITKKKGEKKICPSLLVSYGSYNTFRGNLGLNGKLNNFSYNITFNHTYSKGFSSATDSSGTNKFDRDGFTQNNFQANFGYHFSSRFSLKSLINSGNYKADIDAGAFTDDRDFITNNKNSLYSTDAVFTSATLTLHFTNSLVQSKRTFTDDSLHTGGFTRYARGTYNGSSYVSELFATLRLSYKASLVAGAQSNWQKTDQHYFNISPFGPFETALGDSARINNTSLYTSFLLTNIGGFHHEIGFRYNRHSIYGSNSTYTFNPSYTINNTARVFVNISSAFKTPSLYQLYSEYGNRKLTPEKSINYEAGVQVFSSNKRNSIRFVAFKRKIKNLIIFFTDTLTFASQYINRNQQNDFGFEIESSLSLGNRGSWASTISYVNGKGKEDNKTVKNLYRRPNFAFNSTATIQITKKMTITPSLRFVGARLKGLYDAGPDQMPSYYTIDLYGSYTIKTRIRIFVDLRNVTNQTYSDIAGYNTRRFNALAGLGINL